MDEPDGGEGDGAGRAGGPAGDDAGDAAVDEAGAVMIGQFGDLLDRWMDEIATLTERGVDPEPLLAGLAVVLRSAADHLDPLVGRSG